MFVKAIVHRAYKELSKLYDMNTENKKWAKDFNRNSIKEDIWISNEHLKSCSLSLATEEMQLKYSKKVLGCRATGALIHY